VKSDIAFIVYGPLRSGTTLLRLMINNHPELSNAGEFDYLFDHTHHTQEGIHIDRERLFNYFGFQNFGFKIDETLDDDVLFQNLLSQVTARKPGIQSINIHRNIDHVLDFLPKVKIVKLHRDPRDVACSSVQMGWAGNSYHGVDHWIQTELVWDRIRGQLPSERSIELRYEDLLANPQQELGRVCDFMAVDFSDAMLRYSENSTYKPVDASFAYKWKTDIRPAEAALISSKAPDLFVKRGYEVPENARKPGKLHRLLLVLHNKYCRWRHQMRRHGLSTMVLEKVSRRLGFRRLHHRIMNDKINPTITAGLK